MQVTMKQQVSTQGDVEKYGVQVDPEPKKQESVVQTLKNFLTAEIPPSQIGTRL